MKRLLTILAFLLLASSAHADESVQLARMNPAVLGSGGSAAACAVDYFSDDFTRGDSASVGGSWTESDASGKLSIDTNRFKFLIDSTAAASVIYTHTSGITDAYIKFTLNTDSLGGFTSFNSFNPLIWRDTSDNNMFYIDIIFNFSGAINGVKFANVVDSTTTSSTCISGALSLNTDYNFTIHWKIATGAGANDGIFVVSYNTGGSETTCINITNVDNDTKTNGIKKWIMSPGNQWTTGTINMYIDNIRWRGDDCWD